MKEQSQDIRDKNLFKFASAKRYLKIHVPDFAFKHDDNNVGKDKFVGREIQIRRLYTWLTSDSKSGSYLITGYRGMGKSLLVKRVIDMISREPNAYKEVMFQVAMILSLLGCYFGVVLDKNVNLGNGIILDRWTITFILGALAVFLIATLEVSKQINYILFAHNLRTTPLYRIFDNNMIAKVWLKNKDRRNRKYSNIAITVNLGQEVLNERDVLSLIAHNIREKYYKFVHNRQNRPITNFIYIIVSGLLSFYATKYLILPLLELAGNYIVLHLQFNESWISALIVSFVLFLKRVMTSKALVCLVFQYIVYLLFYNWDVNLLKKIRKKVPYFSVPYNSLDRLDALCERVASTFNEEKGTHPQYSSTFFNFSFGKAGKSKTTPIATVRELEQELMEIVNDINGLDCPSSYCAQFIIVFDELDKVANIQKKSTLEDDENEVNTIPSFESSVRGFTDAMAFEERKQNVLRLLANMKLFITSVKAKCVFISGHELFDASLADLSDREFAISSIFNGVLNVTSFLSPEREEADVSSMTEVYLATMLLPETYLKEKYNVNTPRKIILELCKKIIVKGVLKPVSIWPTSLPKSYLKQRVKENIEGNGILKDELPSLRWYNEYLMDIHILSNEMTLSKEEVIEREYEIRHVMEFLRNFCVYLSHISNGSPKKIATYFEKYIRVNYDSIKQFDWHDEIEVGEPTEKDVRQQCVLFFDPDAQKLINFVHYIAAPVMNAITNEVSHYGDKLLVSSSFILDQIYKYHGNGFSWRNLEQMPELLNTNKNPELRDSMSSIMEFLLQTHITTISSSIFQYKFHKQIAEEISMLSKTSEEAAAIFNFTLNESETVKRYNTRLLWNYLNLTKQTNDKHQKERYCEVLERLHENQGDIYFSEEDYYRAIHEYRSALQYIDEMNISPKNLIAYLKCSLKVGMSYEYRHTFENAYMVYCQIINKLIHLRWMEESDYGLDYTMRLTYDWRVKQTVLVDARSLCGWYSDNRNAELRRHFKSGLIEDFQDRPFKPEYSIDADKTISSLAKNFTPEKSELFLRLTAFEDVKFIYQAIIAKLFVIEKMESSGITRSSIDAAEAEFMTLYSITNYKEKFTLAADFFSKLASILYYKNTFLSSDKEESIYTTLYLFDIDILALIDDYCYHVCSGSTSHNAIEIKEDVNNYFFKTATSSLLMEGDDNDGSPKNFSDLFSKKGDGNDNKNNDSAVCKEYIEYVDKKYVDGKGNSIIIGKWERLKECYRRRNYLTRRGYKLPCMACKYANRSLIILIKQLFGYDEKSESKVICLLKNSTHKDLPILRPEILSQLAYSAEQLADIMMSCSSTNVEKDNLSNNSNRDRSFCDTISSKTIELIVKLIDDSVDSNQKLDEIGTFEGVKIGKLDRVILYYWAACRYYDIASLHHEAVHCIWRIISVIENHLSVLSYNNIVPNSINIINDNILTEIPKFLDLLFTQASRIVSRQYDNYNSVEIHELKWLFHFEHIDDIDLSQLTQFPNLQSIFVSIVNSKMLIYSFKIDRLDKGNGIQQLHEDPANKKYIMQMYLWLTRYRHNRTFKSDVELNRLKAKLNHYIFDSLVDVSGIRKKYLVSDKDRPNMANMHVDFYNKLIDKLDKSLDFFEEKLFNIPNNPQSKLGLIDFIINDSITCLCNIINTLPPHNQFSTFSNSFIAKVYSDLWEWSKYYELMYNAYFYYRHFLVGNVESMNKMKKYIDTDKEVLNLLANKMKEKKIICKDNFGYRYSKLNMSLRHDVDDATLHHIYISYSAEMSIKYYRAARGINSEGQEYKNLINTMYILDDDLRNDTCQSNLADERYLLNSDLINNNRLTMQGIYKNTRTNRIESIEKSEDIKIDDPYMQLRERFADSIYLNTEY